MSEQSVKRSSRPYLSPLELEEQKAWISFYHRVGELAVATAVMEQLQADPDLKRTHLALFLRCSETISIAKDRQARAKRIGSFVRGMCRGLVDVPLRAFRRSASGSAQVAQVAMECLPEVPEPAQPRVTKLAA